ncbi:MAG TPA: serine/threonine-protein kinase [Kofleriaceae bacterium]
MTSRDGRSGNTLSGIGPGRDTLDEDNRVPPTIADDGGPAAVPRVREPTSPSRRYVVSDVIAKGGMGEVLAARDEQIGRPVAVKRLRSRAPSEDQVARFLREVRIQGRLEHPAVVPVHELWYDDDGQPCFAMKRLAGTTLARVFERLAAGEPAAVAAFSRQRLLRAFADVCLAIELAHTRGVVHRDLKPANIMLGDFGEVYVLDWGIARVLPDARGDSFTDIDAPANGDGEPPPSATTVIGALLGTPGYIAPEQIGADPTLDGRADVYSLGCILFELLALQPLHARDGNELASTLGGVDARPSARAPLLAIPPELDAICVRATELERTARFATARELGDAAQRYLDGDRDLALRKLLARAELDVARARMTATDPARHADALRAASRALALDPTTPEPAELVARLMLEPPAETPPEVERELYAADLEAFRASGRFGVIVAIAYLAFLPLLYVIGFREPWPIISGGIVSLAVVAVCTFLTPRSPFIAGYFSIGGNLFMFGLFAYLVTPVALGPGPAVVLVMVMAQHRIFTRPIWLALLGVGATLSPWLLGALGVLHSQVHTAGRAIVLDTMAPDLANGPTIAGLTAYALALVGIAALLARLQDDERRWVRRAMQLHAWQLRQLVPSAR